MASPDLVLGYTTAFASDPSLPLTTASLSIDFVGGRIARASSVLALGASPRSEQLRPDL